MNKYYGLTDTANAYRICICKFFQGWLFCSLTCFAVLHPALKHNYFAKLNWPQHWRDDTLLLLCTTWRSKYKTVPQPVTADNVCTTAHVCHRY